MDNIKLKFQKYNADMAKFKASHKPIHCEYCGCEIEPGNDIAYLNAAIDEKVFCSCECALQYVGGAVLSFQPDGVDDDGYREIWEEKQ